MSVRLLRLPELAATAWKNGGGVTRELAAAPPGATTTDFDWRVSLADVSEGGPFSTFPGVDRVITLIEGTGMSISVDGAQHRLVPHVPFAFSGDADTTCTLASGATRDLNVMTRRGRATASVRVVDAGPGVDVVSERGETVLLVALAGGVRLQALGGGSTVLGRLDALRQDGPGTLTVRSGPVAVLRVRLVR